MSGRQRFQDAQVKAALHHAALSCVPMDETNEEVYEAVKKGDTEVCTWLFEREQVNPNSSSKNVVNARILSKMYSIDVLLLFI